MTLTSRFPVTQAFLIGIVLIIIAVMLPLDVGGGTSYVIVAGNSMEPTFHFGDLVLVRSSAYYQVGDAVVYRHPQLNAVFHRIIRLEGDHYFLKGDNNSWIDTYQPTSDEIVGKLWAHIPKLGWVVTFLRRPIIFILLLIVTGVLFMSSQKTVNKKKAPAGSWINRDGGFNEAVFVAALLTFISLVLVIISFNRPINTPVLESMIYQHQTNFFYTGDADPDIYELTTIQPGEPIFRSVANEFQVIVDYHFISTYDHAVSGYHQLYLLIGDGSGWSRKLPLQEAQTFTGDTFTAEATVTISDIQAIIDRYEAASRLTNSSYQVSVVADSTIEGSLNGNPISDHVVSTLDFTMDDLHLYLRERNEDGSSLMDARVETLDVTMQKPNMVKILNFTFPVLTIRIISALGFILFLGFFVYLIWVANQTSQLDVASHNRMVFGRWIVDVQAPENDVDKGKIIYIETMDDLVKITERTGSMILHYVKDGAHHYLINADLVTYLHVADAAHLHTGNESNQPDRDET